MAQSNGNSYTVADRWPMLLASKQCFRSGVVLAASALNFSEIQLFNPVGSRVIALVRTVSVGAVVGARIDVATHNASIGGAGVAGVNMWIGGQSPLVLRHTNQAAARTGVIFTGNIRPASPDSERYRDWFAIIEPGLGLIVSTDAINQDLGVEFEWAEVDK